MKPAVCFLCGKAAVDEDPGRKGDWIEFSNYEPESNITLEHPEGMEYVCGDHVEKAKELKSLNSLDALHRLQKEFGRCDNNKINNSSTKSMWHRVSSLFKS